MGVELCRSYGDGGGLPTSSVYSFALVPDFPPPGLVGSAELLQLAVALDEVAEGDVATF